MSFSPALEISPLARNVSLSVIQGTFWWTIPNLETSELRITILPSATNVSEQTITISLPKGLYSYDAINTSINDELKEAGFDLNSVTFRVSGATNRMALVFEIPALVVFDNSNLALGKLLGFDPGTYRYQPALADFKSAVIEGQNVAGFDTIQYLTVGTDMVTRGFQLNGGVFRGIIARVGIDAEAGYQILFQPTVPLEVKTDSLNAGQGLTRATFHLMDQDGELVDTNGQDWSLLLRIRYYI